MIIERDFKNHQWVLKHHHLQRVVDFKNESQIEILFQEILQEFRNEQIKKILDYE